MSISGKILYNKVRRLRPDLSSSITPEILSKVCDEPAVQPFLKWFCKNVSRANVLSKDELQIKNKLQKTGEWIERVEIDSALEEATVGYPELLKLVAFNDADIDDLLAEFEIIKESHKEDESYIHALKNGLEGLKTLNNTFDEAIEEEQTFLQKESAKTDITYNDCSAILKQFDNSNREFSDDIEHLLNTYADAAENKGIPILWTQMPLQLYIKQMELYNDYLGIHVRRQFENANKEDQESDSDYVSLINDSKEKRLDEKIQELMSCKTNLTNSKIEEITTKMQEESCIAMLDYVQNIYNSGNLKTPRKSELQTQVLELAGRRDFLEENVMLLRVRQLPEAVQQFAELQTTKILKKDAQARLKRRKIRFEKLRNLNLLAREHGHVHADLLCMLMEMQFRCLTEVTEFVADARHYLTTEYSLSSARCDSMEQQQNRYLELLELTPNTYNSFDQLFISMICGNEAHEIDYAFEKYNDLVIHDRDKKENILGMYLDSKINALRKQENEVVLYYMNEIQQGPTHNFNSISYEINTHYDNVSESIQKVQCDLTKIRNQLKEQMKINTNLEREKSILWQRFLADPYTLRKTYDDVKEKADKSHFGSTFDVE